VVSLALDLQLASIAWSSDLRDISINLLAGLIGVWVGLLFGYAKRKYREKSLNKAFCAFFGEGRRFLIIHSAIFDKDESAWNYPATDTKASRRLARMFESVGLREGKDFDIAPARWVKDNDNDKYSLAGKNLVLLCGPVRNEIFRRFMPNERTLAYSMVVGRDDEGKEINVLKDQFGNQFRSSRQAGPGENGEEFDWAIVSSFPSPRDSSLRIVLLAGIHGTGTVGAAEQVSELTRLKEIIGKPKAVRGKAISRKLRVEYTKGDIETPTDVKLV
jgi:hypothetical protein